MRQSSIKVLRVIARLNIGGPAIHSILLTRHMEKLGYETLLVTGQVESGEADMAYLAEAYGVRPIMIPQLGRSIRLRDDLVAFLRLLRVMHRFRPDIVHTHTAKAGSLGRLAAIVYNGAQGWRQAIVCGAAHSNPSRPVTTERCKVVHTFHGNVLRGYFSRKKTRLFQGIEKMLGRFTDAIVVVSEQQKMELCDEFGVGRPEKYSVIPLGFDLASLTESANQKGRFRARLGLPEETRLVGIIGRLTAIKNHRLFLEAARSLAAANQTPPTRFIMVGDGELRGDLEDLTGKLGLANKVVFTGWVTDLAPLYADLDVLALTSDNEGTPVAVIEAMAAGVPVVATDVGGVRDLISASGPEGPTPRRDSGLRPRGACDPEGLRHPAWRGVRHGEISELKYSEFEICERGILVKRGDAEGFAKGLGYLLDHPEVGREMGRRGRTFVLERHSKERLVADMDRLYRSLVVEETRNERRETKGEKKEKRERREKRERGKSR